MAFPHPHSTAVIGPPLYLDHATTVAVNTQAHIYATFIMLTTNIVGNLFPLPSYFGTLFLDVIGINQENC